MLFDDLCCVLWTDIRVIQPEIVGEGNLARIADAAVAGVVVDQSPVRDFDIPFRSLVQQAVFCGITLQADFLGSD